jgi:diazepam-binding inhibitor (GABA receptor modulator, acyl-CoA-binding protein)
MMSDDLEAEFQRAAEEVTQLSERPTGDDLLELYAFYKQGTLGDVTGTRPGFTDFVGRAKYDAWARIQGLENEEAQRAYIRKVETLKHSDA